MDLSKLTVGEPTKRALQRRIDVVAQRFRSRDLAWLITMVALLLAAVGWIFQKSSSDAQSDMVPSTVALLFCFVFLIGVAFIFVRKRYQNQHWLAAKIENSFPSLQQRLLTAIGLINSTKPLAYLEGRVIDEAYEHSRRNRWMDVVPAAQIILGRFLAVLSVCLLLGVVAVSFFNDTPTRSVGAASIPQNNRDVTVLPGDTEVERGTSLLITAKFSESLPSDAELMSVGADKSEARQAMRQNLSDPVFGALVAEVDQPFQYRVLTRDWNSQPFKVAVFEYPSLVRSDAVLDFPDYVNMPQRRVEDTVRISAVEGTTVHWTFLLNKAIASAVLVDQDGGKIALEQSTQVSELYKTDIVMHKSKRYQLKLVDKQQRKNKYPTELFMRVLPNKTPTLKVMNAASAVVSPLEEFSILGKLNDDFGIKSAGITYSFHGQDHEVELHRDVPRGQSVNAKHLIKFEEMKAEADQLFTYHLWAEDFDSQGELRRIQSDLFFAEVRPLEEIFREGQPPPSSPPGPPSENQQQTEKLAELQKEIMNATWRVVRDQSEGKNENMFDEGVGLLVESQGEAITMLADLASKIRDPESKQWVDKIERAMNSASEELRAAELKGFTYSLSTALTAERESYAGLLKLRAHEFEVSRQRQRQRQQGGSASQQKRKQQLDELELDQEENRYETQSQAETQDEQAAQQRQQRQILSRLRDLARRQEDLNKQLAALQSAIEQAKDEKERKEIERQLKRLREQQQELLRETDELAQRMDEKPQNTAEQSREQLDETRENVRRSSEALRDKDAAKALSAGRRAERQFNELKEEFRKAAANEFEEVMRDMLSEAKQLDEAQKELSKKIDTQQPESRATAESSPGIRGEETENSVTSEIQEQRERLAQLEEKMQETVTESEESEPLLAERLYEAFRESKQSQIDQRLQETRSWLERGFEQQAGESERKASEGIEKLNKQLATAAGAILGDDSKSLKRALGELQKLNDSLQAELNAENPKRLQASEQASPGQASQQESSNEKPSPDKQRQNQQGQTPSGKNQNSQNRPAQETQAGGKTGKGDSIQPGLRGNNQEQGQARGASHVGGSPIAGDGFQEFSDRLRDVEELVGDARLRSKAAQIRDRAREFRINFRRHSKEPQWNLVEEMVADPLRELQAEVREEWMRRAADKNSLVPIDRDPVPHQYSRAVKQYYENLGRGESAQP